MTLLTAFEVLVAGTPQQRRDAAEALLASLRRCAASLRRTHSDLEDCVQLAFERVYRMLLRGPITLGSRTDEVAAAYLCKTLRHVAYDRVRERVARTERDEAYQREQPETVTPDDGESPEQQTTRLKAAFDEQLRPTIDRLDAEVTKHGTNAQREVRRQLERLRDEELSGINELLDPQLADNALVKARNQLFTQHKRWRQQMAERIEAMRADGAVSAELAERLLEYLNSLWVR